MKWFSKFGWNWTKISHRFSRESPASLADSSSRIWWEDRNTFHVRHSVCYCVYNRAIIRATPQSLRRQSLPKTLPPSLCSGCPQTYCCLFCSAKLSRCVWVYRRSKVAFSHYLQALRGPRRTSNAEDRSVGPVGVKLFVTHLITPPTHTFTDWLTVLS